MLSTLKTKLGNLRRFVGVICQDLECEGQKGSHYMRALMVEVHLGGKLWVIV